MSSTPAIKHTDLFDFDSYFKGIEEAEALTLSFSKSIEKMMDKLNGKAEETKGSLTGLTSGIANAKDAESLSKINKQIDSLETTYRNAKDAAEGLSKSQKMAVDSVASLKEQSRLLTKELEGLSKADLENAEIGGKKIKQLAELKNATNEYSNTIKSATKSINVVDGSYSSLSQELARMRSELRNMPGAFNQATGALNSDNKAAVDLADKISKTDAAVKAMDATMGQFGRNVGNYEGATVSLKKELKDLTTAMVKLKMEGKEQTEEYIQMRERAGELKDTMGDVKAEIKETSSDTKNLEGMTSILTGVAGAASTAEGAMAMFGDENKDVAQTTQKLVAVMAVLNGLQEVTNFLQKDSKAILFVIDAQKKADILITQLQGAAESKNIIIRYAAIVAQKALNAVMKANPVGLLITVVAALAAAFVFLTMKTKSATEKQQELNEIQAIEIDQLERINAELLDYGKKREEQLTNELALAKAQGKSWEQVTAIEMKLAETRLLNAAKQKGTYATEIANIDSLKAQYNDLAYYLETIKRAKASDSETNVIVNYKTNKTEIKSVKEDDVNAAQGKVDDLKKQLDKAESAYKEYTDAKTSYEELAASKAREATQRAITSSENYFEAKALLARKNSALELSYTISSLREAERLQLQNSQLTAGERYKIEVETNKKIDDLRHTFYVNQLQAAKDGIDASLVMAQEGSEREFQLKKESLKKQNDIENQQQGLSAEKRELITANYLKSVETLEKEYLSKRTENELNAQISLINARLSLSKSGSDEEFQAKKDLIDKNYELEKNNIETTVKDEQLKASKLKEIWAQSQKEKEELENQQKTGKINSVHDDYKKQADEEIALNNLTLASSQSTLEQKAAALKSNSELQKKLIDNEELRITKLHDEGLTSEKEYQDAIAQLTLDRISAQIDAEQKAAEQKQALQDKYFETASQAISGFNDIYSAYSDARVTALQDEMQKAEDSVGDNANAKARIEAEYQKKIKKEKRKAAIVEKVASLFQIGLDTAKNIVSASNPAMMWMIPWIIATGAIQAAVVAAKPIPQYRHGRKDGPEEMARVNDQPGNTFREMIVSQHKAFIPQRRNQLVHLNKGDRVIPAVDTAMIMRTFEMNELSKGNSLHGDMAVKLEEGRKLEVEHNLTNALMASRVNEDYLIKGIGRELSGLPIEQNIYDERGYRKRQKRVSDLDDYLRKKHS